MQLEIIRSHDIPCVIAGDFNIDLTKYKVYSDTSDYLNTWTIILPSRITKNSSTLIDHIYYYQGRHINQEFEIASGNLWSDLTDHLPNYFLIINKQQPLNKSRPFVRIFSEKNITNFRKDLAKIDWNPVYFCENINIGYHYFANKIKENYDTNFKLVR